VSSGTKEHKKPNLEDEKRMEKEIIIMRQEAVQAITKSEIESQVDTAKKHPRDIKQALNLALYIAVEDKQIADSCFYAIPRGGKIIRGASVRFAELVVACWGNVRSGARVIANDGKTVTAQGICHDIEKNVSYTVEVTRKITDKNGNTFSEDMQIVNANAACSIALRNAIFKVIPFALTMGILSKIEEVAKGSIDLKKTKKKAIDHFTSLGVTESQILYALGRRSVEDITAYDIFTLRGIVQAINDGDTDIEQAFHSSIKNSSIIGKASSETPEPVYENKPVEEIITETENANLIIKQNKAFDGEVEGTVNVFEDFTQED
jgi:hypothetical protein